MYTNITANFVALALNFLLITGRFGFPALGVRGAAISAVTGNITMFIICVINVSKKGGFLHLTLSKWKFKPDKEILKSIMNVTSSAFVEQIFMRIGFFTTVMLIARLDGPGVPVIAAYTICMNLQNISFTFGDGLSIASSSLVGRSLGAKRPDMAIIYGKISQRLALMISAVLFVIFIFGRYFFIGLFTDTEAVINMAVTIVILIAVSSPFQLAQVVFSGSLRGAGDTKFVAAISFVCIVFIRPALTWAFCYPLGFGLTGAWIALIIDQAIRLCLSFMRFTQGKWTEKKV
jgi:putative MATE family efflux protein